MMFTSFELKKKSARGLRLLGLVGFGVLSMGLAGCAGLVSGGKASNGGGTTPLTISNVSATGATVSGFQVGWSTSAAATSQVAYGKTTAYGSSTAMNSTMVSAHQVGVSNLAAGTLYHFQVQSTDGSGNVATSGDMTITTLANTTPPSVSITSPGSGATISGSAVIVTASATDSVGIASVQFKVDSVSTGTALTVAPYTYALNTTTLTNGNHTITAVATDLSGNAATSAGVTVTVNNTTKDTTPPTVSMTAPANGATVTGTVTVSATASDNVAVASVQFQLDNANVGTADTATPYTFSWDTTTVADGSHTLKAIAQDTSGNSASSSIVVTVSNNSTSAGTADYEARCNALGVVRCVGFDQASDVAGTWGDNSGIFSGATTPALDTTVKASGNSSLKFTIPAHAGADTSGSYFTNFSSDLMTQFGQNTNLYIQWRQRFSPEFLSSNYLGGEGWKQSIIGTGDVTGCNSSSTSSACSTSCTDLEVVTLNNVQRGFAEMYNSCTGSTSHGPYDGFEQPYGAFDFKLQNAMPTPYCLYSQGQTSPTTYLPPAGNCFGYFPNEWMTFQVHLQIGPRVNDEFVNSYIELWIAREGQPATLVINFGPYNLSAGSPSANQEFGKVWLLPYNTGKDSTATYPVGYTWFDELIISSQRVPDPK